MGVRSRDRQTVRLAYGDAGMPIEVPRERVTVVVPRHRPAAPDAAGTLHTALRAPVAGLPLRELVRRGQRVAISVCDITRPQPRALMLLAILEHLEGRIPPEDITVIVATGTHRANTPEELTVMLGPDVVSRCHVVNHDARDRTGLVWMGHVGDVPVWLARDWVDADVRITTGFVEPHFFAGFSGGPKMVAPGLAGLDTTLELHSARRIGHPRATWGITDGNPVHDAVRAVAAATGVDFAFDVLLDDEHRITHAFAGELFAMHSAARQAARRAAMQPVPHQFDIVVTTNSGYPLDQNLYQAIKGMSAGAAIARPGGTIICAAECRDGLPQHGAYRELLAARDDPRALLEMIEGSDTTIPDQWQVQIQARIQVAHRVLLKSDGLSADAVRAAHLEPIEDVGETIEQLIAADPDARIAILPQGPQTIPYVS